MNGNDRRRMELIHPENTLTSIEKEKKKENIKHIFNLCKSICMTIMVLGTFIVAYIAAQHRGWEGFSIAFFGIIFDVILGVFIAYNLGNKIQKLLNTNSNIP